MMSRRALVASLVAIGFVPVLERVASARPRIPLGGKIAFHLPWPLGTVDPHRIDDVAAAVLGDALFDTLYARDDAGALSASLAEAEPRADSGVVRVTVRSGIHSAAGRPVEARDAAASLSRARARGAKAWLGDVPAPRVDGNDLIFATRDPQRLMRALASPLTAIVPAAFNPGEPDGTGPLRAVRRGDGLALVRNGNAARGPSFLDEVLVRPARLLSDSLQEFEKGADDLGWLGSGYYDTRPGSRTFDAGAVGWAILRTGREAGTEWDAPGVAQSLADGIPHAQLASLVVGPPWPPAPSRGWGGPPCDLLVRDDSPWLVALAKDVGVALSTASHEVTVKSVSAIELAQRRSQRSYALAIDVARPLLHGALGAIAGLATADDPQTATDIVRRPPRGGDLSPRAVTRTMRVGVVAELRVQGGRVPDLLLPVTPSSFGIDFGAATREKRG